MAHIGKNWRKRMEQVTIDLLNINEKFIEALKGKISLLERESLLKDELINEYKKIIDLMKLEKENECNKS
jgi:hypothetical protein